jgi:hypothetical protein
MHHLRQQKLRVLDVLERRAKTFRTTEELYPCRIPREPLTLGDIVEEALGDDASRFDPLSLRSRTLLHLTWDDHSTWELWVLMLPSGLKLFCDGDDEEARVLASGGRQASAQTDRQFLQLFSETAGELFGVEMAGGAPARVRASITDRDFLLDFFVNLFEVTETEDSVKKALRRARARPRRTLVTHEGSDFRADADEWLHLVMP